jgi:hypothetical protein
LTFEGLRNWTFNCPFHRISRFSSLGRIEDNFNVRPKTSGGWSNAISI